MQKIPEDTNDEIADILDVSPTTFERWKEKDNFFDKKSQRKSKMTRNIKNFLLKKCKSKFIGINKASSRKLAKEKKIWY